MEEWDKDVALSYDTTLKEAARSWEQLVEQSKAGKHGRHMSLIVEIRQALKEYRTFSPSITEGGFLMANIPRRNPSPPKPSLKPAQAKPKSTNCL